MGKPKTWTITISGVDLGERVPDQLKPHDFPYEAWATQAVHDLLSEIVQVKRMRRLDVETDKAIDAAKKLNCEMR